MNLLEINYRGRIIKFRDDDETWACPDLSIEGQQSLSAVKRKIDELSKGERRIDVRALLLNYCGTPQVEEVTVTVLCEPETYGHGHPPSIVHCWIKSKEGRSKVRLDALVPVENIAELQRWVILRAEAKAAHERADKYLDSIPRHDADSLLLSRAQRLGAGLM